MDAKRAQVKACRKRLQALEAEQVELGKRFAEARSELGVKAKQLERLIVKRSVALQKKADSMSKIRDLGESPRCTPGHTPPVSGGQAGRP